MKYEVYEVWKYMNKGSDKGIHWMGAGCENEICVQIHLYLMFLAFRKVCFLSSL